MEPELDGLFVDYVEQVFRAPVSALPPGQIRELKRAFIAGAWTVLTSLPMGNLGHGQATADTLRQQCQAFNVNTQAEPLNPLASASAAAQDAPAATETAPAAT